MAVHQIRGDSDPGRLIVLPTASNQTVHIASCIVHVGHCIFIDALELNYLVRNSNETFDLLLHVSSIRSALKRVR